MNEWLSRARDAWDNLTQRERLLLSVVGATTLVALLFFLVVSPLLAFADRTSFGVGAAEQQLQVMKRLRRDHDAVTSRLAAVEQRIREKGQNSNLLSLLESLAETSGVKTRIESMEERQAQANETYRETKVEVELKQVTLTQTVSYLHNIEQSPQLLSVKSLRVKTRADKSSLLDVTFAVSSFEPL